MLPPRTPPNAAPGAEHAATLLALRHRAEQRRHLLTRPAEGQSPDELQRLVQELQLHQSELEMQNEELLLAQTEVQRAQAWYVDLYDFAPVGYVMLDADGVVEQLNLSAARLLGTSRQRLDQRLERCRFALFVVPTHRPAFQEFLLQAQAAEHSVSCELQLQREDGTAFFAQLEALLVREPAGPSGVSPYPPASPQVRLALLDSDARRLAADELAASAALFRTLFEQSPDGMLLIENSRYVDGNAAVLRLLGLTDKCQLRGRELGAFSPKVQPGGQSSAAELRAHLATAQRQGWSRFEWHYEPAAGPAQRLEVTAAPVVVGSQPLMQFAVRDITAQRAAQEALRVSEERLQMALEASQTGTFAWDLTTGQLHWDAYSKAAFGRAPDPDVVPVEVLMQALHPDDAEQVLATTNAALVNRTPMAINYRVVCPDGAVHHVMSAGRLVLDAQGQPRAFAGVLRDVTAMREAEQELSYKNRLLDRLLHSLPVILSQLSPDGRYLMQAGQGLRRLGLEDNAVVGREAGHWIPEIGPTAYRVLAGETLSFRNTFPHEGQLVHYQSYGFFDEQQQRAVVFSIDITEQERLREETRRQQHEQQQQVLAATLEAQEAERRRIAESLHNGLGQLLYAAKLTLSGVPSPAATQRALALLDEAVRATRTISFELTPGVLNDFGLAAALHELAKRLPRQPLPLRLHLHGLGPERLPPPVEIAAYRIAQELINNVIKHAQATEAALHVSLDAGPPARLHLLMQDNGQGFDVAAQAGATAGGQGLRSIRHRVELLGGHLELDAGPGHGTTVTVELPAG